MMRWEIVFERGLINRLVRRFANRSPDRYEQRWAWIFPAWFLVYELEVLASGDSV